mgnify:CR=1 FL=1
MKNLNLESFGVQEMDAKEMANVEGGGFWALIGFALVVSAIENFGDIREGFSDGVKGKKARY